MTNALINGIAADYLNINDRAIHYGDGLFETVLCSNNVLFYWEQHYQRLQKSAKRLKLNCPDEQILLDDIKSLLKEKEKPDAYAIKIMITRGVSERGYVIANNSGGNRLVLLSNLMAEYSSLLSGQLIAGELYVCKQQVSINESLAGLKHLNRLENVLARNEWNNTAKNNFIDGLMLNANNNVIECTMSNLFAVKNNQLYTPDLSQSGVSGIMRDMIIESANRNNIQTSIVDIKLDDLFFMEEIFISNSLLGMKSVNKIKNTVYQSQTMAKLIHQDLLKTKDNYGQVIK